eukprot:1707827-Pleurochrysis_carterae.AAC.1
MTNFERCLKSGEYLLELAEFGHRPTVGFGWSPPRWLRPRLPLLPPQTTSLLQAGSQPARRRARGASGAPPHLLQGHAQLRWRCGEGQ